MRILHFIIGKANLNTANGVNYVINGMCSELSHQGNDVFVVGLSKSMELSSEKYVRNGFEVLCFRRFSGVFSWFLENVEDYDYVHFHSVWKVKNIILAYLAKLKGVPYFITVHSGLEEDRVLQSRSSLKRLFHFLVQHKYFDRASGIHCLTREEMTTISKWTSNKNLFVVHNGVVRGDSISPCQYLPPDQIVNIGYIGRLSVEKNVKALILAVALLPQEELLRIRLSIAGPSSDYGDELQGLVEHYKLSDRIKFVGPLYGADKEKFFRSLSAFVHPAFSDVVSIALMEAWSFGLPSIVTRTSQVSYFDKMHSFIMVEPLPKDLARGLKLLLNETNLKEMSNNCFNLVAKNFNWTTNSALLLQNIVQYINQENGKSSYNSL